MRFGILELVGLFLVVIGCGTVTAAASMVAVALGVLSAGVFLLFGGAVVVFVAVSLERAVAVSPPKPSGERP